MKDAEGFYIRKNGTRDPREPGNVKLALHLLRARWELDDTTVSLRFFVGDRPLEGRTQSEFLGALRFNIADSFGFCPSKAFLKDVLRYLRLLPPTRRRKTHDEDWAIWGSR